MEVMLNWNTIILGALSLLTTLVLAWNALHLGALNRTTRPMAEDIKQIHTAVNSERTAMIAVIGELKNEIRMLASHNATLEERLRLPILGPER
jgi:hypothetical protein